MIKDWFVRALPAILLCSVGAVLPAEQDTLSVAAVQFEVDEATYRSPRRLERRVSALVKEATNAGADLVVFPEYINVFLLVDEYAGAIERSDTAEEALERIVAARGAGREKAGSPHEAGDSVNALRRILENQADETEERIIELWGRIARREEVYIVAGTYFAPTGPAAGTPTGTPTGPPTEAGAAADGDVALANRALVFDPRGNIAHVQDKSFLTPFEKRRVALVGSDPRNIDTFEVNGFDVAVTICRDSFFDEWESRFRDADLWIELRANGERYTQQVRERFEGALAERVAATPVTKGISAGLTGSFLDFFWEGPAYVVDGEGARVDSSEDARGTDIVFTSVQKSASP